MNMPKQRTALEIIFKKGKKSKLWVLGDPKTNSEDLVNFFNSSKKIIERWINDFEDGPKIQITLKAGPLVLLLFEGNRNIKIKDMDEIIPYLRKEICKIYPD